MQAVDYLAIGHVCKDLTSAGPRLGGTVTFAALTARALGLSVGVVTSAPDSLGPLLEPLAGIPVARVPAAAPTTFENRYSEAGRIQMLAGRAAPLDFDHVPPEWREAAIVHLAPVADEVAPSLAARFPGSLVCVTPQGWLRQWDAAGRVSYQPWPRAADVLAHTGALVLSVEDVQGDEALLAEYAAQVETLAVTRGAQGCTLTTGGQAQHIPAPAVTERDPTGAGDIFAAAFFARLRQTADPVAAARFATHLASDSVTREGLASIPGPAAIQAALAISQSSS
jgi:sugar/nucleoside kinase (ribokinase family)